MSVSTRPEEVTVFVQISANLIVEDDEGNQISVDRGVFGGGVVRSPKLVVTAAHVIFEELLDRRTLSITVRLQDSETHECRIVNIDRGLDLAVLQVVSDYCFPHYFEFAENVEIGKTIDMKHHPLGLEFASSGYGRVAAERTFHDLRFLNHDMIFLNQDLRLFQFELSVGTHTGSSGCGVFDEHGGLMGINIMGVRPIANFAVHKDVVKNFCTTSEDILPTLLDYTLIPSHVFSWEPTQRFCGAVKIGHPASSDIDIDIDSI